MAGKNDSTVDFKQSGMPLALNEKYLEAELGGTEAFILMGYKFNF